MRRCRICPMAWSGSGYRGGCPVRSFGSSGRLGRGSSRRTTSVFVEVIDDDYEGFGPGGLVEDCKIGFGALFHYHSAFKRMAVVTDKEWVVHVLQALAWMVPGEFTVFARDDFDAATQWAVSD